MALKIFNKGIQISLALDQTAWTGNIDTDSALLASFVGGKIVGVNGVNGFVALGDGAAAGTVQPLGFLVNDASGYFYENKPALASGMVAVTHGNCVVSTDQLKAGVTFVAGDLVYCGSGADAGLVVKVAPTGATPIGVALTAASGAGAELTIAVSR
jgi:hypothetical protein